MQNIQHLARVAGSFLIIRLISNILLFQIYSLDFYKYFLFPFSFLFRVFTKYKYLAFLLFLAAVVCIMRQPLYKNDCVIFNSVNKPANSTYKANVFNKFLNFLTYFSGNVNFAVDISMNSSTIVCRKIFSGKD